MPFRIIISGGGTGGHIFPALSIADEVKRRLPDAEILFVGADGRMEMTLVPKHGYAIEGLPIDGFQRGFSLQSILRNIQLPFKIISSVRKANALIRTHKPQVIVGVGGYASAAIGIRARSYSVPLVVCEQNAFPGITNKMLSKHAQRILLGNADAKQHFVTAGAMAENIHYTGNPIRQLHSPLSAAEAKVKLGFLPDKPLLLVVGGSLGARTLNESLLAGLSQALATHEVQLFWQCGKTYHDAMQQAVAENPLETHFAHARLAPFIDDMATAFAAADVVVSRAGASTISEMIALQKPCILVPSPNVSEDHQTKNALSLTNVGAAQMVRDADARDTLLAQALQLLANPQQQAIFREALAAFPQLNAASAIVDEIMQVAGA